MEVRTHRPVWKTLLAFAIIYFVWLDDCAGRALTKRAPMGLCVFTRYPVLRPRLRIVVLGRAACSFGNCSGYDGQYSGVYGAVRNRLPANPAAHVPIGLSAVDRNWRSGSVDEPIFALRRVAGRQGGRDSTAHRVGELVDIVGADAQAAASPVQSYELRCADARRRRVSDPHGGRAGRIS